MLNSVQELMTIATCEMKEEDTSSQVLFWQMINSTMAQCGFPPADFQGFMADEAGANWCAVRTVFNGGPHNIMPERERTCLFHWKQSLHQKTRKNVQANARAEHIALCEQWRLASNKEEAFKCSKAIREWWREGHVTDDKVPIMDLWLSWWEVRIAHWGNLMAMVLNLASFVYIICRFWSS